MSGLWIDAEEQRASVNLERASSLEVVDAEEAEAKLIATFDRGTWYSLMVGTAAECHAERLRLVEMLRST